MNRGPDDFTERIANIQASLEELKTSQFTSQNSGMKFSFAEELTGTIPFINGGYQVTMVTNYFTPTNKKPTICIPSYELDYDGFAVDKYEDYSIGYVSYNIYDSTHTNFLGLLDIWPFFHLRNTNEGTYGWQTVAFVEGSANFSLPIHISLRATDTGIHTLNVETSNL